MLSGERILSVPGATAYFGDCLDVLRSLPDDSADAVVTDPPYSSGGAFRGDRAATTGHKYVQSGQALERPDFAGDNRDQRSYLAWCQLWLSQCHRIARPGSPILVFTDWRQLPTTTDAIQCGNWVWRGIAVWDKTPGVRPARGRFTAQAEYVIWGSKGPWRENGRPALPGVFTHHPTPSRKHHQAGKPVEVMRWLVRVVRDGGVVLDPFMGSGSTGVACLQSGLSFVGIEQSDEYARLAASRLEAVAASVPRSIALVEGA